MTSIEVINVSNTNAAARTLGLLNANAVTSVTNNGSVGDLTVSNITSGAALAVNGVDTFDTTFTYAGATSSANLTINDVTSSAGAAVVSVAGVGTLNVTSSGTANNATLTAAAASTINIAGEADFTVATTGSVAASLIDANTFTGDLALTVASPTSVAASTDVSVLSGSGDDTITVSGVTLQDKYVALGDGDDTVVDTAIGSEDTIDGGTGTNTLSTTYAQAAGLTTTNVSSIDVLSLSTALDNTGAGSNLTTGNIDSEITAVTVAVAGVAGVLSDSATTITGGAGSFTLNLGTSGAGNAASLGNQITVTDTGTGTTDALTVNNLSLNSTNNVNANVFNALNFVSTGYETVSINTGSGVNTQQTIGTLTITADSTSANTTLTLAGTSAVDINALANNTRGLVTIDASGLTATTAATTFDLTVSAGLAAGATESITGSAGNDAINTGNFSATVLGGAGLDSITAGSGNDSVRGGEGDDTITAGTGNDYINGDEGDDFINMGTALTAADTVDGGAGTNTVEVDAAVATSAIGSRLTNVSVLQFGDNVGGVIAAVTQDMSVFTGTTFTQFTQGGFGGNTLAITNASSSLNQFNNIDLVATVTTFARATDTSSDALTVNAEIAFDAVSTLTASNEETITIAANTFAADLDLLTSTDLTTLNITGSGAGAIVLDAQAATNLSSIVVSGLTGTKTLSVDASDSTTAITFAGGTYTGDTTILGGSLNDVITAGSGELNAEGNGGNDSLTGSTGVDTLNGGIGADTLTGNAGNDNLTGGVGLDTFNVNAGTDVITDLGQNNQADILVISSGAAATVAVTGNWTATSASQNNASAASSAALTMGAAVTTVNLDAVTGTTGWSVTGGAGATGVTGSDYADTITVATSAASVTVTGGAGADSMTASGVGVIGTTFNYVVTGVDITEQTGVATAASLDAITSFDDSTDFLKLGVAASVVGGGGVQNYQEVADAAYANYAAILAAGNTALATVAGVTTSTVGYALVADTTGTDNSYLFIDTDLNGVADAAIQLVGILGADFGDANIIA